MAGDATFEMEKAPAGNAADLEQVFPSESAEEPSHTSHVPWWHFWNSRGSWQEVATNEKGQLLQNGKAFRRASLVALISIAVNLILLLLLFSSSAKRGFSTGKVLLDSWAVNETSSVVTAEGFNCFGRGLRFADSLLEGCECNQCYTGADCSQLNESCTVDVSSGTPTLFEDYWSANLEASTVLIPATFRIGYSDGNLNALEQAVRKLHDIVGNAVTEDKQLIVGAGSTQVIFGLLHAISIVNRENGFEGKTAVTSKPPYYNLYSFGAQLEHSDLFEWQSYADINASAPSINFVVSPNNPDGRLGDSELPAPSVAIHDFAYYWPHFTPIIAPADYDVMLFTLSKVSGHAGSRVGWTWVRDPRIAAALRLYLSVHSITMAHESQYRATKIINAITAGYETAAAKRASLHGLTTQAAAAQGSIFHFSKLVMQNRWDRLHAVLGTTGTDSQTRITIQPVPPAAECSFFQRVVTPSPAYAYLHCSRPEEGDCFELLKAGQILGRPGTVFGGEASYVRLSLLGQESDFALVLERLQILVNSG